MYYRSYGRRNLIVEFIQDNLIGVIFGGIVIALVLAWYFTEFLPVHNAKAFFEELGQKPGFTKLVDTRQFSDTADTLPVFSSLDQGLDALMDKARGYRPVENFGDIKAYDTVELLDSQGQVLATGEYLSYWTPDKNFNVLGGEPYHIIMVYAPGKGLYDREFKIESNKVILRKKKGDSRA